MFGSNYHSHRATNEFKMSAVHGMTGPRYTIFKVFTILIWEHDNIRTVHTYFFYTLIRFPGSELSEHCYILMTALWSIEIQLLLKFGSTEIGKSLLLFIEKRIFVKRVGSSNKFVVPSR
jgi:hypothetical protein